MSSADGGSRDPGVQRPSIIFLTVVNTVFRTAIVFSLFLLFAGHNAPGGGFVGGLVAGAALVLRHVAAGVGGVRAALHLPAASLLGLGLVTTIVTGAAGWLWGDGFLNSASLDLTLPLVGDMKATSALGFDAGVFLVVVGVAASIIHALDPDDAGADQ